MAQSETEMHGTLGVGQGWDTPRLAAASTEDARPGYRTRSASEYVDTPRTLKAKAKVLACLLRKSGATVAYTGAGISTSAGMPDYASKAKGSIAPHIGRTSSVNRLELSPTYGHAVLAALQEKGLVHHLLQQNHDRLAQKAGFPQQHINEIHGAWGDDKNQVKMMDDTLRDDLLQWALQWARHAEVCIALGTTLCGMSSDCVAAAVSGKQGLVIINLQATDMDSVAALRFWGRIDDVLKVLVAELKVKTPNAAAASRGSDWTSRHARCKFNTPKRKASDPL
eukprot:TRINITY_DN30229_c0_g1_i1.p1 TRINITY_DN30229_c0_g1~~TRINITY_DN30229_c0_g1_i1.p1  ORF type:complete len:281 (+),score=95.71 TRINITY_DN30229_c0_g1_i1:67-909(+)